MTLRLTLLASIGFAICIVGARAAQGDTPVRPLSPSAASSSRLPAQSRSTSLPAHGLFAGDQLTPAARARLAELIADALEMDVDVALLVPTGPWRIDGSGRDERDLTPARLQSVKRYLTERGVDPKRIFVESRVDASIKEPRLDIQFVGRPGGD